MNVGESKVLALEAVGELFVVEAKEMEESRVEVVDVDFSIDYAEATARNFLLEERSRTPGFGGLQGGERGVVRRARSGLPRDCCENPRTQLPTRRLPR